MKRLICLIAEDSSVERDGLRFLIESRQYPVRVLEASDGEKALAVMDEEPVDILITDIRMPFMDGLALSREVRRRGSDTKILICSAYGEFSYAKQAIDCGVSGYLLKPVQRAEFYRQFEQVLSELEQEDDREALERLDREKSWYDVTHGRRVDADMRARLTRYGVDVARIRPVLMLLQFSSGELEQSAETLDEALSSRVDGLWALDMSRAMLLVAEDRLFDEAELEGLARDIQASLVQNSGAAPTVLTAQPASGLEGLYDAWQRLEEQSELRLFAQGSIHSEGACSAVDDSELLERLNDILSAADRAMDKQNYTEAYARLEDCTAGMRLFANASALYMRYAAMKALSIIAKSGRNREPLKALLDDMNAARTTEQIVSLVEERMPALLPESAARGEGDAVATILRVIHERYMEPLTLDSLAQGVHFSPTYVSALFRKQTGTTLIKYLTNYRMERATEMLLEGRRPVTEIAQRVGYDNTSYFSLLFKARYGVSPAQYRKAQRAGDGK
ncbi:MAG: response regulator [Clostridia bacterium]|nr:response regulator [Clostridia bacterium]